MSFTERQVLKERTRTLTSVGRARFGKTIFYPPFVLYTCPPLSVWDRLPRCLSLPPITSTMVSIHPLLLLCLGPSQSGSLYTIHGSLPWFVSVTALVAFPPRPSSCLSLSFYTCPSLSFCPCPSSRPSSSFCPDPHCISTLSIAVHLRSSSLNHSPNLFLSSMYIYLYN